MTYAQSLEVVEVTLVDPRADSDNPMAAAVKLVFYGVPLAEVKDPGGKDGGMIWRALLRRGMTSYSVATVARRYYPRVWPSPRTRPVVDDDAWFMKGGREKR